MYIENKPIHCRVCNAGPYWGQEVRSVDRMTSNIIVECVWKCARCGSRFAEGVVKIIPAAKNEKNNQT